MPCTHYHHHHHHQQPAAAAAAAVEPPPPPPPLPLPLRPPPPPPPLLMKPTSSVTGISDVCSVVDQPPAQAVYQSRETGRLLSHLNTTTRHWAHNEQRVKRIVANCYFANTHTDTHIYTHIRSAGVREHPHLARYLEISRGRGQEFRFCSQAKSRSGWKKDKKM